MNEVFAALEKSSDQAPFKASFMIYGYRDRPSRCFRKFTRISTSAVLEERGQIALGDHVWIGHMCILDGSGGISIGTGVHLAARVSIFTHGSHIAIRLYGTDYIRVPYQERIGYVRKPPRAKAKHSGGDVGP